MAYQVLDTQLLQSAIKAASQVTAALITAGDDDAKVDPQAVMNTIADDLFAQLKAKADADNEQLREEAKNAPAPRQGGGSFRGGGQGGGNVEADGSMKLTWGKFKGHTIAEIYEMDEDQAKALGYAKPGAAWVEWLSKNKDPKLGFSVKRAKAFLDNKRS